MVDLYTPSTGEQRAGGDLRLNVLRIKPGESVLFKASGTGWAVGEVMGCAELGVTVKLAGGQVLNVEWREVAGVMQPQADAAAVVNHMRENDVRYAAAVDKARAARVRGARVMLDSRKLRRSNSFVPGM